jgi:hypothetical protein
MSKFAFASVGAAVASGVVVAALLAAPGPTAKPSTGHIQKTSALPVLKLRSSTTSIEGSGTPNTGLNEPYAFFYDFHTSPSLSSAEGSATAYQFSSPSNVAATTDTVAEALGIGGGVTYLGPDNYNGGPSSGPDVTVDLVAGILNWQYPTWSGNAGPQSIPVDSALPLPSNDQATAAARQLLLATGMTASELGAPQTSRYEGAVNVSFQVVVGGLTTDQVAQVSYGPGSTVLTASGVVATAESGATYPTIAPTQAVDLLAGDGPSTVPSGATGSSGSHVVDVTIDRALLVQATYVLANGSTWLLPTWVLSGTESGPGVSPGSSFSGDVLAIASQYVQSAESH